jgi:hypothetical protein
MGVGWGGVEWGHRGREKHKIRSRKVLEKATGKPMVNLKKYIKM